MPQPSVPLVNPHDYVTCAKHNARRLARFCTPCPVYNADHEIIDYVFECRENQLCSSAQRQANSAHGAHASGRADTQEGAFGRRGAHEDVTGEGMNTESVPAQPMVFDASSSSSNNATGAHNNARHMFGGMQGGRNDAQQQQQQQTGTTLFSVSFTAPSETKETRNAELSKSASTSEPKAGQEGSNAHNATAKQGAAAQGPEESSAMGQTMTATTSTMSTQDKEDTHEEEENKLGGSNNNKNNDEEESTRLTHTIASNNAAGGVEVSGRTSERPTTASSPTQYTSPRAPLRYYDMLQRAGNAPHGGAHANSIGGGFGHGGAMASMPKKVCWYCGLTGHEKQECTNTLCRSCHARRPGNPHNNSNNNCNSMPAYHTCVPVRDVSPFIVVPRLLPQGRDAMPAVRCVSCGAYGHFDCSAAACSSSSAASQAQMNSAEGQDNTNAAAVITKGTLNCCFCGGRGHTAFDCYERKRINPDRWEQRVLALAGEPENNESRYYSSNNNAYNSYGTGNTNYRQGVRGNAETERRSYYTSGTNNTTTGGGGGTYQQPYTSSRVGASSNNNYNNYNNEDTYSRQNASSTAAQANRYTSPTATYNTPYHAPRSETNYAGREAPVQFPSSSAASASASRRRPREVYESEYNAQARGYEYNTGSTNISTGTNDERAASRAYREERPGTNNPAAALREYDDTATRTDRNAVRREERHRSASGSHHSHHSHHRHHRSERGDDDHNENDEGTHEASSHRARHDSRRRGDRNNNNNDDEEEDYIPRSARRGNVSDEANYAGRTRRHEEGTYGRYNNNNNNNNSEGMTRNALQQQQQQQSSYDAYNYGGNAGRAERNSTTRDYRTPNTTQSYQQQQQTSQPRYASPSYRDKRGNNSNNTSNNAYHARAEEVAYGRRGNETRQYGYNEPQRWRSEANNTSRHGPQSRTGQYQRGGRNNNNISNRYNDDESDLY